MRFLYSIKDSWTLIAYDQIFGHYQSFHFKVLLPQSVLSNPLGVKLVPHSGVVGPRKLGDPFDESQVETFFQAFNH